MLVGSGFIVPMHKLKTQTYTRRKKINYGVGKSKVKPVKIKIGIKKNCGGYES